MKHSFYFLNEFSERVCALIVYTPQSYRQAQERSFLILTLILLV